MAIINNAGRVDWINSFITGKCSILPSVPYLFFYNPLIRIFKTLYIYPRTVRTYKYKGCSMSFLNSYSMSIIIYLLYNGWYNNLVNFLFYSISNLT